MLKKLTIRNKLILSILIGCLIPFIAGSIYVKNQMEDLLFENNIDQTHIILQQTANHVDDAILKNMQNLITMIARDERVVSVTKDINSYVTFNPATFVRTNTESERQITEFFKAIQETHDLISLVSIGTELGGYIEYPIFNPNSPYDPRTRGWYLKSIDESESIVSEPYETKESKELVVSVDKVVTRGTNKIGVVSLTIGLNKLMQEISEIPYGATGYIDILSPSNVFINSPGKPEWLLKSTSDIDSNLFNSIDAYDGKSFEGTLDGVERVFNVYISPISGWKYVSVIDKSEILGRSKSLSNLLILIFMAATFIMIFFVVIILTYITKPIGSLTQIIKKMANFEFEGYVYKDFEDFTHHQDEIGDISRALHGMQNNFIELKKNIELMDLEIQNVKVEERTVHQINLSNNNPFSSIADSVNGLLRKVHSYVAQINAFNSEISHKNDLLTASEEELIAQLDEINLQKEQIHYLADHDPLTNLPNRRRFYEKLNRALHAKKTGAVLMLDMDNFKSINDTLGHIFGDKVLQITADLLSTFSSPSIFVSRFGGDEFLILYEFDDQTVQLDALIKNIYGAFDQVFLIDDNDIRVDFSMGLSLFPDDSADIEQIIMNADLALYEIKNNGKNGYAYFNQTMASHLKHRLDVKSILIHALENDGFKMVYQPQVDLKTGETTGFEALVRLKHHAISPADFIRIAEDNGLIIPIGRVITKHVIEQISLWLQNGFKPKPVSINFSALQINDLTYINYLYELLAIYQVKPELIVIEITEHFFLENKDATIVFMNALRAKGIRIAVDDFGTEYSSLSYLAILPIDILKFDRDLNLRLLNYPNKAVIKHLIAFVHSLNLQIVAEGIEECEHVQILIESDCDCLQGYYFSTPLEVQDVTNNYDKIYSLK